MPKPLPILEFDWQTEREIAENIYNAQRAGWPSILTYDYEKDLALRRQARGWKRDGAMNTPGEEVPFILSRDEYPFACTKEHRGSVWVGHVPAGQNSRQGGQIAAFLRRHGATDGATNTPEGFKFVVRVVNYPPPQ